MSMPPNRVPVSTYRVQLHAHFTFAELRHIAPYLAALGVTECYCSPPFTARAGSTHGYDVTNHNEINPELGGWAAFDQMASALAHHGLGLIVDFVPNHMGNDTSTNAWWRDVLENGPSSPYARVFDIDWDPVKPELKNRLLLPILGEPYGEALEAGRLQLAYDDGALVLQYGSLRLPINPRRGAPIFEARLDDLVTSMGSDHRQVREFQSILTALHNLPPYTVTDPHLVAQRMREKDIARERLTRLVGESEPIRRHVLEAVAAVNGRPGDPASFAALHTLLEQQVYRLAHWRTAADEINYRRFFDVNDLAGLRTEDAPVFNHIHELVLQLVADRKVTGLRLDHVDGLADPAAYLERLEAALRDAHGRSAAEGHDGPPFYVVVEKILTGDEELPAGWATAGTTGYNFLNDVNGVFVDTRQQRRLTRTFQLLTRMADSIEEVIYESKRVIIGTALASELQVLASAVNRVSESHPRSRDFTLGSLRRALREVVACFPVYRTYVSGGGPSRADRAYVRAALATARERNPATEPSIFEFLGRVLLADGREGLLASQRREVARKFQQYTAPVQAKGVEDTAFYRYNALLSLNEVGGDPDRFGRSVEQFHAANRHRREHWPHEMLATATHDTKRGEDARARLNALSELPQAWRDAVTLWMRVNRPARATVNRQPAPDRNDEYHYYQALLAIWPQERAAAPLPATAAGDLAERMRGYMTKAIREAKRHTSWINPNHAYESAVLRFVDETLQGGSAGAFLASFVPFARRVARAGALNSIAQLVLKLASPGVPDFYQGTEFWDLTLVDPDNRRPVDYAKRRECLTALEPLLARAAGADSQRGGSLQDAGSLPLQRLLDEWCDGRIKLFVSAAGLRLRRERPGLFLDGSYEPLDTDGLHGDRLVAFGRAWNEQRLLAIVPRLTTSMEAAAAGLGPAPASWADTRIRLDGRWRSYRWRHAFTGERVGSIGGSQGEWLLASQLFAACPVALLVGVPA